MKNHTACKGHPAGESDPMGETVHCDGSCNPFTSYREISEQFDKELMKQRPSVGFCPSGSIYFCIDETRGVDSIWITPDWNSVGVMTPQLNGNDGEIVGYFGDVEFTIPKNEPISETVKRYLAIVDSVIDMLKTGDPILK